MKAKLPVVIVSEFNPRAGLDADGDWVFQCLGEKNCQTFIKVPPVGIKDVECPDCGSTFTKVEEKP